MTTVLDPPRNEVVEASAPRRRGRWIVVCAVLVAVAALLVIPLRDWYLSGYRPLRTNGLLSGLFVEGPREREVQRRSTYAGGEGPSEIAEIPFQLGGRLEHVFTLSNVGERDVLITHISAGRDASVTPTVLDPEGVEISFRERGDLLRGLRPFEPFTLPAGGYVVVSLKYRFACQRGVAGASEIRDSVDVRFEALGGSRWVELSTPHRLVLHAPTREECPPGSAVYGSDA